MESKAFFFETIKGNLLKTHFNCFVKEKRESSGDDIAC